MVKKGFLIPTLYNLWVLIVFIFGFLRVGEVFSQDVFTGAPQLIAGGGQVNVENRENYVAYSWFDIQQKSKDAVVQIFNFSNEFDWLKPFATVSQSSGRGTGFFINENGYILTNFHVVDQAAILYIQAPCLGKERFEIELVGCCPYKDIAVLKLKEKCFDNFKQRLKEDLGYEYIPYLPLGDSDNIVGPQEVMVLGYPLGQENLKSSIGITSGTQNILGKTLIQTTAPVNPGNSGGPFFDAFGYVIGIQVAGIHGAQGVGYFIPISDVKNMVHGIVENRYDTKLLKKPFWGVVLQTTTEETLKFLGVPSTSGVRVSKIIKNALFYNAGIKKGDIICKINGIEIDRYGYCNVDWCQDKVHLHDILDRFDIGEEFSLTVYQESKGGVFEEKELKLTVAVEEVMNILEKYPFLEKVDYEIIGGMVVMELTTNHLDYLINAMKAGAQIHNSFFFLSVLKHLEYEERDKSVLIITHVFAGSSFERTRCFDVWDILEEVNGIKVESLQEFRNVVKEGIRNGYLTVETRDGSYAAVPLEHILEGERYLANTYNFNISTLVEALEQRDRGNLTVAGS